LILQRPAAVPARCLAREGRHRREARRRRLTVRPTTVPPRWAARLSSLAPASPRAGPERGRGRAYDNEAGFFPASHLPGRPQPFDPLQQIINALDLEPRLCDDQIKVPAGSFAARPAQL